MKNKLIFCLLLSFGYSSTLPIDLADQLSEMVSDVKEAVSETRADVEKRVESVKDRVKSGKQKIKDQADAVKQAIKKKKQEAQDVIEGAQATVSAFIRAMKMAKKVKVKVEGAEQYVQSKIDAFNNSIAFIRGKIYQHRRKCLCAIALVGAVLIFKQKKSMGAFAA